MQCRPILTYVFPSCHMVKEREHRNPTSHMKTVHVLFNLSPHFYIFSQIFFLSKSYAPIKNFLANYLCAFHTPHFSRFSTPLTHKVQPNMGLDFLVKPCFMSDSLIPNYTENNRQILPSDPFTSGELSMYELGKCLQELQSPSDGDGGDSLVIQTLSRTL